MRRIAAEQHAHALATSRLRGNTTLTIHGMPLAQNPIALAPKRIERTAFARAALAYRPTGEEPHLARYPRVALVPLRVPCGHPAILQAGHAAANPLSSALSCRRQERHRIDTLIAYETLFGRITSKKSLEWTAWTVGRPDAKSMSKQYWKDFVSDLRPDPGSTA